MSYAPATTAFATRAGIGYVILEGQQSGRPTIRHGRRHGSARGPQPDFPIIETRPNHPR